MRLFFSKKIKFVLIIFLISILFFVLLFWKSKRSVPEDKFSQYEEERIERKRYPVPEKEPLPPPSMDTLKEKGCVADGLLFGYEGDLESTLEMINRSKCQYLHRAVETWLAPPDFWEVALRKDKIKSKNIVYGMFIAEAIDKKSEYYYLDEDRNFDFSKMCRKGSDNFWGEHTCKPSFERREYRKYLRYIIEQAIDQGIQVFLFGQIFYQERSDLSEPIVKEIIEEMREYAAFRGISILVGAQTNNIQDENYLRLFDFIEGGVGLSSDGKIEEGPCFSRWWSQERGGWCWALLWHKNYSKKANDILLHLDWSGKVGDDMSVFSRMSREKRSQTLKYLHNYFTSRNFGFLLPLITPLSKENNGCHGDRKKYYTADKKYTCRDEDAINKILK